MSPRVPSPAAEASSPLTAAPRPRGAQRFRWVVRRPPSASDPSVPKTEGVEAITAQGARLVYLPPYSPDLNPIEQAFAKLKAALRRAAERTRDGLWQAIGRILERYQPQECRNFFKNAGYAI